MKKLSLLFATILVLVSSIVFCSCNNGYKNLKITADVSEINLVLDDENLSKTNIIFELSGVKSWGEISIVSKPEGMVKVEYEIKDKQCGVSVTALQPTGEGSSLIITHLGSGKSLTLPLKIGMKLQTVQSSGLDFVIGAPKFSADEIDSPKTDVKEIEIPTKQLLNCYPSNYTDTIIWQASEATLPEGVSLRAYDIDGNLLNKVFNSEIVDPAIKKREGTSNAVKTVIAIGEDYVYNKETKTTIVLNPISILDGKAVLHTDVDIDLCIVDLLNKDEIKVTSDTHGDGNTILQDLVLISNPDSKNPRTITGLSGYDFYSTALIDFELEVENPNKDEGEPETILKLLGNVNSKFADLYDMELSSDIPALTLEKVDFAKIRAIATSTCVGSGQIKVDFVPKACVGDIKSFSINIPCVVGERATSFTATNNGQNITINKDNDYTFNSITGLNDSNSLGQAFKFDILSTHTLKALKGYRITINKNLLYINPDYINADTNTSKYIKDVEGSEGTEVVLTDILSNKYEYQIAICKDGKEVTFYQSGEDYLVSEPLATSNTIYMKWVKNDGGKSIGETDFGIKIANYYDQRYNINNNKFDETALIYNLKFNRQRTVSGISYVPVKVNITGENAGSIEGANDAGNDWQFYFQPADFDSTTIYYGIHVKEVLGLNGAELTSDELANINVEVLIDCEELGFAPISNNYVVGTFGKNNIEDDDIDGYTYNYDSNNSDGNIILLGKIANLNDNYGDFTIEFKQSNNTISSKALKIYKNLTAEDISVTIPTADFGGSFLEYQRLVEKPADFGTNYSSYYKYNGGGEYTNLKSNTWESHKVYYKKVTVTGQVDTGAGIVDVTLNSSDTYILATSKTYEIKVEINNKDFVGFVGQDVGTKVVYSGKNKLSGYGSNIVNDNNNSITTPNMGSFKETAHYIQLTYTIKTNSYEYYKINPTDKTTQKVIYLYIYEPLTSATFDSTMLYKYHYDGIHNSELKEKFGKQTLNIELNNNSQTILNYVDIEWSYTSDGIKNGGFKLNSENSATFTFFNKTKEAVTGRIVATLTQFGVQYPIYAVYQVSKPILSEQVILNTPINAFKSGQGYINLKVGESITIDATAKSPYGEVSLPGFEYVVCSTEGYNISGVADINKDGVLTATTAGKAKLIIVAKDVLKSSLQSVSNYFKTTEYLASEAYLIVDIIVSDGTEYNPFLIASGDDFRNIKNDYYYMGTDEQGNPIRVNTPGDTSKTNDYHYALVNDIDLSGISFSFENFDGSISSYQEGASENRFNIYGVMLDEANPNLFVTLNQEALLKDINFHIGINYVATEAKGDVKIGLVGTNNATIEDVTAVVSGSIDGNSLSNNYTIGSIASLNTETGTIKITDTTLVGVEGQIIVSETPNSKVVLGGVVGENQKGAIVGANPIVDDESEAEGDESEVEYDVYYDNQGATADIVLQVKRVMDTGSEEIRNKSAIGGVVGYNNKGTITNVYSLGSILGIDDAQNLRVNNVGGLIGKNDNSDKDVQYSVTPTYVNIDIPAVKKVEYDEYANFAITNSYSSAQVIGNDNVGGAVGYDYRGSYKKVYYEIYTPIASVQGENNVGGLIGYTEDSNLYYCYANSFAWGYKTSVEVYDVSGKTNVGGLIGYAKSLRSSFETSDDYAMNVVSSIASLSLTGTSNVSGIIGKLENYGAIFTGYFYGVIDPSVVGYSSITKMYNNEDKVIGDIPYNNVYAIVNGVEDFSFYVGTDTDFNTDPQYNNGKPYVKYGYNSLVSIIPTVVEINKAFYVEDEHGKYVFDGSDYIEYDEDLHGTEVTRYSLIINAMYKQNNKFGEYVWDNTKYVNYNKDEHGAKDRYTLMAQLIETGDSSSNNSDYRAHAIVLYYYQFTDMSNENALNDLYALNTIDMHELINDRGIIVLPNTFKRFNLRSSDAGVASVLSGGRLLLNNEGQVTITLISTLNPSATASFVIIVRSKVLEFGLHSNANLRDEYNINGKTINIVKNSSKIIYADYSSTIQRYNREYAYKSATNMAIRFEITYTGAEPIQVKDYITLNEDYYNEGTGIYIIPYGIPITISVNEYTEGKFTIRAIPCVIANYTNNGHDAQVEIPLNHLVTEFTVATKQGARAVNIDKTQINMMPADEESNLNVKISTDIQVDDLYFEIDTIGDKWEIINPLNPNEKIKFIEMLEIYHNGSAIFGDRHGLDVENGAVAESTLDISGTFDNIKMLQSLNLTVKLNEKSHYINESFRLQVTIYVLNGETRIESTLYIDVIPQQITSVTPLNYRMPDADTELKIDDAYQSQVIRPGATNIITIDIAPNIAVYDHIEIVDTTIQDRILFQQVKEDLSSIDKMEPWVDSGIKLEKYNPQTSKVYVLARLPKLATANITHTIQINVYDKDGKVLYTTYLNLEAVMYPRIEMVYTNPKGDRLVVDTQADGSKQVASKSTALAMGVEAPISITTFNADDGSLKYGYTITNLAGDEEYTETYKDIVKLEQSYNGYILTFDSNKQDKWSELLGKQINVTFTASKTLNGITETCKATIEFQIKRLVIHGASMTHTSSKGNLYGYYDKEFETEFYFDRTDISYYYLGYWNIQYTLTNTNPDNYEGYVKQDMQSINNILKALNTFGSNGVSIYYLNKAEELNYSHLLNANYTSSNISIKNVDYKFKIKATPAVNNGDIDINDMKWVVKFKLKHDNAFRPVLDETGEEKTNQFGFDVVDKTSPFDEYIEIDSQQEFEDMVEGRYYRLTKDLTFTNYSPINVAIGGFTGDGYTITITEFNLAQLEVDYLAEGMYVGLFGKLAENSVVQNLQVKYEVGSNEAVEINLNYSEAIKDKHENSIYFGGIAGQNMGVITNVNVMGNVIIEAEYISADHINLGGITAVNGSTESTKVASISASTVSIRMEAMSLIGGVAGINYGKITNSNFTGTIESHDSNQYVAEVATAGFVVENMSDAYISLSYVQTGLTFGKNNIKSVGRTAGFVLNNNGTINNCYINQTAISSQGNIGGFVYQNYGVMKNNYANASLGNSLFYNEFIYATSDSGEISNCYVITDSSVNIYVNGLSKIAMVDLKNQSKYSGFIFANSAQGVWSIGEYGPTLANSGFNPKKEQYDDIYNIYDVETFEGFFETNTGIIEGGKTFKLVRDIDFESQGWLKNPSTFNKTLKANFEGNDMALINYNIYTEGDYASIGLFANISTVGLGTYVRNLILQPVSIKATTSSAVGALAGTIDSVNLYNIVIDNVDVLMLGKNAVGGLAGVIKGNFEIRGISSNISAFATYYYNTGSQYNMYMGKNETNNILLDNITGVSYAGSIAGIVDGYNLTTMQHANRNINQYLTVSDIEISEDLVLIGETVGGAFGLVGERTLVKNLNYNMSNKTSYQGVYVSGGLVGENRGIIQTSNIYSFEYIEGVKTSLDTSTCFDGFARVNGAIVGLNVGGLIDSCTSDIDVVSNEFLSTVGGIVGRNIEGSIYDCTISGMLDGFFVGGVSGTDYSYNTIVKENGYGSASIESIRVYESVRGTTNKSVAYDVNCFVKTTTSHDGTKLYVNNKFTNAFMTTFISRIGKHYTFNKDRIGADDVKLVEANSIYGLVVGLTDTKYKTSKDDMIFINKNPLDITISLTKYSDTERKDEHKKTYDDGKVLTIPTIMKIGTNEFTYNQWGVNLLYVIAYQGSGFDSWSSISGYSDDYNIVLSMPK